MIRLMKKWWFTMDPLSISWPGWSKNLELTLVCVWESVYHKQLASHLSLPKVVYNVEFVVFSFTCVMIILWIATWSGFPNNQAKLARMDMKKSLHRKRPQNIYTDHRDFSEC